MVSWCEVYRHGSRVRHWIEAWRDGHDDDVGYAARPHEARLGAAGIFYLWSYLTESWNRHEGLRYTSSA